MPWAVAAAAVAAGGAYLASSSQASAEKQAANTSAAASNEAVNTQLQMYNQTASNLSPFLNAGTGTLPNLQSLLAPGGPIGTLLGLGPNGSAGENAALQNTPGYQFAVQQGGQALDRSAAARGTVLSGGQLKDAETFGQGLASQLYGTTLSQLGTYAGQLGSVVNTGENAGANVGNAGTATGGQVGTSLLTGANQQAGSIAGAGTATASGYTSAANNIGTLLSNADLRAYIGGSSSSGLGANVDDGGTVYSDRRLKTDIKKIGKAKSGLNIYSFRMKGSPATRIGVMSDEVRKIAPRAVKRDAQGFDKVDYGKVSRLPAIRSAPHKRAA